MDGKYTFEGDQYDQHSHNSEEIESARTELKVYYKESKKNIKRWHLRGIVFDASRDPNAAAELISFGTVRADAENLPTTACVDSKLSWMLEQERFKKVHTLSRDLRPPPENKEDKFRVTGLKRKSLQERQDAERICAGDIAQKQ